MRLILRYAAFRRFGDGAAGFELLLTSNGIRKCRVLMRSRLYRTKAAALTMARRLEHALGIRSEDETWDPLTREQKATE